jgi:hypothetical protein
VNLEPRSQVALVIAHASSWSPLVLLPVAGVPVLADLSFPGWAGHKMPLRGKYARSSRPAARLDTGQILLMSAFYGISGH